MTRQNLGLSEAKSSQEAPIWGTSEPRFWGPCIASRVSLAKSECWWSNHSNRFVYFYIDDYTLNGILWDTLRMVFKIPTFCWFKSWFLPLKSPSMFAAGKSSSSASSTCFNAFVSFIFLGGSPQESSMISRMSMGNVQSTNCCEPSSTTPTLKPTLWSLRYTIIVGKSHDLSTIYPDPRAVSPWIPLNCWLTQEVRDFFSHILYSHTCIHRSNDGFYFRIIFGKWK